jgi:hypothetical protein
MKSFSIFVQGKALGKFSVTGLLLLLPLLVLCQFNEEPAQETLQRYAVGNEANTTPPNPEDVVSDGDCTPALSVTTTNYSFDGGIGAAVTALDGQTSTTAYSATLEGIVTASNIYYGSGNSLSFILQDQNEGILIFNDTELDLEVGDRISVDVSNGQDYFGTVAIETFDSGSITEISTGNAIYYQEGDWESASHVNKVFRYEGILVEEGNSGNFFVGEFQNGLNFHIVASLSDELSFGEKGIFYGPVTYSFSTYRQELTAESQFCSN